MLGCVVAFVLWPSGGSDEELSLVSLSQFESLLDNDQLTLVPPFASVRELGYGMRSRV